VTDEVADWSGDWVVKEIAARADRPGPRPVSEDHKPGLVHPDVDRLINYLHPIRFDFVAVFSGKTAAAALVNCVMLERI
jgi:hypothetical protein